MNSFNICICSGVLANSVITGTSGNSGFLFKAKMTIGINFFPGTQSGLEPLRLLQLQPQRESTSPRSTARVISEPPW